MTGEELEITEDRITVVLGLPGSGKTGLVRRAWIDAGKVAAYQPQHPYLFRDLVGVNLGLGLTAEQCGLAGQYARRFGLESLLAEPAVVATVDECARVTLARTLARPERFVILDEPLGSIAPEWRTTVIGVVGEALANRTGLVATADTELASVLADRLAIVAAGRVTTQGEVDGVVASEWWPIG